MYSTAGLVMNVHACMFACVCPLQYVCYACHVFALSWLLTSDEFAYCAEESLKAGSMCPPSPNTANTTNDIEEVAVSEIDDINNTSVGNGTKIGASDEWSLKMDTLATKRVKTTQGIMRSLFACLQKAFDGMSDAERTISLKNFHTNLLAQKMRLGGEVDMLRDKMTLLQQSECELNAALTEAKDDCRKVHRKLDRLAASGVKIPDDFGPATKLGGGDKGPAPGTETTTLKQPISSSDLKTDECVTSRADDSSSAKGIEDKRTAIIQGGGESSGSVDISPSTRKEPGKQLMVDKGRTAEPNSSVSLEEITALRQENLELNKELTRVIRMYKVAPSQEQLGEIKKLKTALDTQIFLMENERSQQLVLQADMTKMKGLILVKEESHNKELEAQRLKWKEHIQTNLKALETLQMEKDSISLNLEQAKLNAAKTQELQLQINEYEILTKTTQAEIKRLREAAIRGGGVKKVDGNVSAAADASIASAASCSSDDVVKDAKLVISLKAQLEELQSQCVDLSFEVDQTSQAYDSTNEQNARLLEKVSAAESSNAKLQKEITRLHHQLVLVGQERQAMEMKGMEAEQMRVQSTQYVERSSRHAKEVEAALRKKDEELTLCLKQQHEVNQQLLKARVVAEDSASNVVTLRTLTNTLQERCDKLAEEASASKASAHKAQEEVATEQRNNKDFGGLSDKSSGGVMNRLRDELNGLKQLLRCNVCSTRQKDCIITKCWHAFCRECIDTNLRNRHRKCPACGKSFGADDVGDLWL